MTQRLHSRDLDRSLQRPVTQAIIVTGSLGWSAVPRSLRGRLIAILLLLAVAALASGSLMVALFRQSARAEIGEAEAQIARSCDAIETSYRFYTAGWQGGAPALDDPGLRRDLTAVVYSALRNRVGIEGGLWQSETGSLAYAFPTYEGSGPKTDFPEAERATIGSLNRSALREERSATNRVDAPSQVLLLSACPLAGPVPQLTAWTMTRVHVFAGRGYVQLMAGLVALFAAVLMASLLATRLILSWSRHVGEIETTLIAHDIAELPVLAPTGERELDRIVLALNEAGRRLEASRLRAEDLSRRMARVERLAAVGRLAAGIAHEIRNPIAAMRLKAETAQAGTPERKDQALSVVLVQVDRLDALVRRLLTVGERETPRRTLVEILPFLEACAELLAERAQARGLSIRCRTDVARALFDPEQLGRALDNLLQNALQAAPDASTIRVAALARGPARLVFAVTDEGDGPPAALRDSLFEPFVTGRAEGTGLGLSIVRETAEAHGGTARFETTESMTTFEIEIPLDL
jgi:signal transduction histidine kinase